MQREAISNEEFAQWKSDPITRKIIERMDSLVEYIKQQWYESKFAESEVSEEFHRGYVNGIHEFLRIETVEYMKRPDPNFGG
jgi:hypothetical protein